MTATARRLTTLVLFGLVAVAAVLSVLASHRAGSGATAAATHNLPAPVRTVVLDGTAGRYLQSMGGH